MTNFSTLQSLASDGRKVYRQSSFDKHEKTTKKLYLFRIITSEKYYTFNVIFEVTDFASSVEFFTELEEINRY